MAADTRGQASQAQGTAQDMVVGTFDTHEPVEQVVDRLAGAHPPRPDLDRQHDKPRGRRPEVRHPTARPVKDGGPGASEGAERVRILAQPCAAGAQAREVAPEDPGRVILEPRLGIWVDILRPGAQAAAILRDGLGLDPLTVEDCLTPQRMPKIDRRRDGGMFVAAFAARVDAEGQPRLRAVAVDLVLGLDHLATVHGAPVAEVAERLEATLRSSDPLPEQPGGVLARTALDAVVDAHLPVMVRAAEVAEELEDRLDPWSERSSLAALEHLIVLRRDLLAFRRLAVAQQEVLRRLGRVAPEVAARLADVADNEREAVELADATRDYIDGAIEVYRLRRDARTEGGIRRLTVLAGILGPLSLVIGQLPGHPGHGERVGLVRLRRGAGPAHPVRRLVRPPPRAALVPGAGRAPRSCSHDRVRRRRILPPTRHRGTAMGPRRAGVDRC